LASLGRFDSPCAMGQCLNILCSQDEMPTWRGCARAIDYICP
jgi:hypothetical protein